MKSMYLLQLAVYFASNKRIYCNRDDGNKIEFPENLYNILSLLLRTSIISISFPSLELATEKFCTTNIYKVV